MELVHAERHGRELTAVGTQLGAIYELRYRLEPELLRLELVGQRSLEVALDDADFFDVGWSPLFNSLVTVVQFAARHSRRPAGARSGARVRDAVGRRPLARGHHIRAAIRAARQGARPLPLRELHR